MENVMSYLVDEALILIPVLWFVGTLLKNTPVVKDWLIPWILMVVGMVSAVFMLGFTPESVVQGVLVTSAAVAGHQLLKQTIKQQG